MTNPSTPTPPGGAERRRGDWLLRLALSVFALGLLAIIAIFTIPLLTDSEPGLWLYFGAMLAPLGFVLALVFALRSGRRSR
ncbi:hypothetical protein ACWEPH_22345 [Nocardia beijingensis]|uniref:Uncharacterized protein n=1 Tax=Nocardia beijingensis TaxID=95162 RepID=A0ABW7WJ54_9NOCA|nr:hypothetical protein [Nocardia beijingensis]